MSISQQRPAEEQGGRSLDVLVLGPGGGRGGINHYVRQQRDHLDEGIDVSTYGMRPSVDGDGLAWLVRTAVLMAWSMVRFPFRERPDVVHVHTSFRFSFYRTAPYVLMAALLWRRPVVLHVHGSSFDEFLRTDSRAVAALQSVVFAVSDRIVILSPYWRDLFLEHTDGEKLVVLPNAVDPGEFDPQFNVDPPRIVFVSSLIERKGVDELVDALQSVDLDAYGAEVDVAGSGPFADRVEALAERHDRVSYWGYVSEDRKRRLLEEGSIFVLPTYAENLPIALLEGMAGGNAVIATPVGGIPDVVDSDNGVLVDPGDVDELAAAMTSLLSSPDTVEAMARRNRDLIVEEYNWDVAAGRLRRVYESVLEE